MDLVRVANAACRHQR
ncbi:hypothetical protein [Nocardia sp. NBC_00416]